MLACIFKLFGLACTLVFSYLFFEQKGYAENYLKKESSLAPIPASEQNLQTVFAEEWLTLPDVHGVEGPVFEQDGKLLLSDLSGKRILRISKNKEISTLFHRNDISLGGLAIDQTGHIIIASLDIAQNKGAILSLDHEGKNLKILIPVSAGLLPNDVVFDRLGGLYISDFRGNATDPSGGIYYLPPEKKNAVSVLPHLAMANGIAISPNGKEVWVTEFARNILYRLTLSDPTHIIPLDTNAVYYFTGAAPDSTRTDKNGNIYVAIYGQGRVLVFSPQGIAFAQILLPRRDEGHNLRTTSMAINKESNEIFIVTSDDKDNNSRIFKSKIPL